MKRFVYLIIACAASTLFGRGQSAPRNSTIFPVPEVIRKPDFTISNANAQTSSPISCNLSGTLLALAFDNIIQIYEMQGQGQLDANPTRRWTNPSPTRAMSFWNSNTLVTLSTEGIARTWSTVSARMLSHVSLNSGHITVAAFASDLQPLAATGTRNRVMLWNFNSGNLLTSFETTDSTVSAVAFTPDGRLLVVGTHKGVVRVLDVAIRRVTRTIDLDSPISALAASMKYIVIGYTDGTLAQLSFGDKTSTHEVNGHSDAVTAIAFSPQGERFASGSADGAIKIREAESLKPLASLKGSGAAILSIAFSADGQSLVSSNTKGVINGWRLSGNP